MRPSCLNRSRYWLCQNLPNPCILGNGCPWQLKSDGSQRVWIGEPIFMLKEISSLAHCLLRQVRTSTPRQNSKWFSKKSCVTVFLSVLALSGCRGEAETVSCSELKARSMKWQEPKVAIWRYQGTEDSFHYFYFVDLPPGHFENYRVAVSDIQIRDTFPRTSDQKKWRVLPWGPWPSSKAGSGVICGPG